MSLFANELFLYDANEKTELSEVVDNKLNLLPTTSGKTFTLSNGLSITTKTNDYANYVFPHQIAVNQLENTSVYFSQTQTVYENDFTQIELSTNNGQTWARQGEVAKSITSFMKIKIKRSKR